MFKKISALSTVGFALFIMSGCSDNSSTAPNVPSNDSVPTCTAKKKSNDAVETIIRLPGISTTFITTTLNGDKVTMEVFSTYNSNVPAEAIREECEENKREAEEEHDDATVTCEGGHIKIVSVEDAEGATVEKLYEKAVGECQVFEKMLDEEDGDSDDSFVDPDNNSSISMDPTTPSDNDTPLLGDDKPIASNGHAGCMVLNDVENEFQIKAVATDSLTIETTDRFSNDSIYSTNIFTFGPKVSQREIDYLCEDYKVIEIYDSNTKVSCEGNIITFSYIETDPYSNFKQSKDDAIAECNLIQQKGSFNTEDTDDTPLPGSDNRQGKATCKINTNSANEFEMVVSDADTATMLISIKYDGSYLEQIGITTFNENLPQSFIDQECAEAKEDALEDDDGSIVTCEGNSISLSFKMEYPMNPIYVVKNELVAMCNKIQETGIIPDDE